MSVTYSATATIFRSTLFGRNAFRQLAFTSKEATKEFAATVDLTTTPLPTFPILIAAPDITSIQFVGIQVTGGTALIRLTHSNTLYNNIDIPMSGTVIMSGVDLKQITVLGTPSGSAYVEVFGMGT
jgi:hypothetical protein